MSQDNQSVSEAETEQKMYQAMAEHVQTSGIAMTAQDIQSGVAQFTDSPPAAKDDDKVMQEMADYQAEHAPASLEYAVRGALLHCNCGSHHRKLNLPRCHGTYILQHPQIHEDDCIGGIEGPGINVPNFGVCNSPANPSKQMIFLVGDTPRNADGTPTGAPASGTVQGMPCVPMIIGKWENTHENTKIGAEEKPAVTTDSFLVCAYGGLIELRTSGQENV